ncbi:MAG: ATPase domain-containing protein [Methanobacteriota archaeon]
MAMRKIRSGVYGLNQLIDGGINENTVTAVIGSSGAGKTTFATYFLKRGLEDGEDAIFITLDESPDQIIKEVREMGWEEVDKYIDEGSMVFVDASGKQFSNFIRKELANFVEDWKGHGARIVIDPLTPVLWSVKEKYEQRELVSYFLRETRKIGTVLCTLEEHGVTSDLSSPELVIPMYLADNVIHLRYKSHESPETREMKIIKCRSSRHSKFWHPYRIVRGAGILIENSQEGTAKPRMKVDLAKLLERKLNAAQRERMDRLDAKARAGLKHTLDILAAEELGDVDVNMALANILEEYGIQ